MKLSEEQEALFRKLCADIKPGEYGRVEVSFVGHPSNITNIKAEKTHQYHNQKAVPTHDQPQDRQKPGRY